MKCGEREKLFAYGHRFLAAREQEEVGAHVAGCAACRAVVEEYGKLDTLLDGWQPSEPSPWFEARMRAAIAAESARAQRSRSIVARGWARWLAPALGLVLVLTASFVVWRGRRPPQPSVTPPAASLPAAPQVPQNVVTPAPAPATLPLPAPQMARTQPVQTPSAAQASAAEEDLNLYRNLTVLEEYDLFANFEVLSELSKGETKVAY
jgi:hypothetical protein